MAWDWADPLLSGMVAGEYKQINGNTVHDVALARTLTNFGNLSGTWTTDADVLAVVLASNDSNLFAFSGPAINFANGDIENSGGGHTDGGDGTRFKFNTSTLLWEIKFKSCRYQNTAPTASCGIISITPGTPPRIIVDADVVKTGDRVVITDTPDANGTYQAVRISATEVDLYNTNGVMGTQYTAFSGGSLTDSTGTATVTWNAQGSSSNYYSYENADGQQMPPCMHTYHQKWIGDDRWLLSGSFVKDANARQPGRIWIEDGSTIYRSYHSVKPSEPTGIAETSYGGMSAGGPIAYDPVTQRVYTMSADLRNFNYRLLEWEAGQGSDSDFQLVRSVEFDGSNGAQVGYDACTIEQPGDASKRAFFSIHTTSTFNYCSDLGGSEVMSRNTFSDGAVFQTDMDGIDAIGFCEDQDNGTIVYWGGGSTIGEITTSSTLSAWTSAEITPATPTGDVPDTSSMPNNATCAICKVPGQDAYLLTRGSGVWLYARSDIASTTTVDGTIDLFEYSELQGSVAAGINIDAQLDLFEYSELPGTVSVGVTVNGNADVFEYSELQGDVSIGVNVVASADVFEYSELPGSVSTVLSINGSIDQFEYLELAGSVTVGSYIFSNNLSVALMQPKLTSRVI